MTTKIKSIILGIMILGFLALTIGISWMGANNKEISLKNQIEAQQKVCQTYYDKLWKIIQQKSAS